jgi:hypothetical protein
LTNFEEDNNYEECVVTFFDVLGFKNLVNNRSGSEVIEMLNTFRRLSTGDEEPPVDTMSDARLYSQVHTEIVSDAIVRSRTVETQQNSGPLVWELLDLLHIQIECVGRGILIRGATTIGHMHLGINFDGPVFGPALIEAYEMEDTEVIYPRIAIHEDVLDRHRENDWLWMEGHSYEDEEETLSKLLTKDGSGFYFIDYLRASLGEIDGDFAGWIVFLEHHKELIDAGLDAHQSGAIRRKYSWLKSYHNAVIEENIAGSEPDVFNADLELCVHDLFVSLRV